MRVLITGATGLIGSRLQQVLHDRNFDIHYLSTQKDIESKPGFSGFYWNPAQGVIDENCMLGVDVIIHLAGAPIGKRWTQSYKQEIIESRILSANLLYKTLKNNPHQVRQIIAASAIGVYPNSLTNVYTEDNQGVDRSFLGDVVVKWEESVDKFKQLGLKVAKLRTGLVFSDKGGMLDELVKPIKFGLGSAYGSGKQQQSWIHIDDLVNIYLHIITNQLEGIYNGVAPNPVTNSYLTKRIAEVLSKPYFMPSIPASILKLILGDMHYLLVASQNVSADKIVETGYDFKYPVLEVALVDLLK